MIVPYDHLAGPVLSGYRLLYNYLFTTDMTFTFENYVKSQVHLPILPDLHNRSPYTYLNALGYISHKSTDPTACIEVLRYYYSDLLNMLVNILKKNPEPTITIVVEALIPEDNYFPVLTRSLPEVRDILEQLLDNPEMETPYSAVLALFSTKELAELKPTNVLAMAGILSQLVHVDKSPVLLEVLT